jgi:mannose-6-phosphate isomerase-like protein (cupin superfamily)
MNRRRIVRARSDDPQDYQDVRRPFAAMAKSFADGFEIAPHHHKRDQLIYAVSGVMRVRTAQEAWIVPPDRAVYVPARTTHSLSMRGDVGMRTLYIAQNAAPALPTSPTVIGVSDLLRALILALIDEPLLYDVTGRGGAIVSLLVSEIARATPAAGDPHAARSPAAPRLRGPACDAVGHAHARRVV